MPFTTAGHNALLDGASAAGITHVEAFDGDPEGGGSVVSVARAAVSFAAAGSSQKVSTGTAPALSIGAGETVSWLGFYTASSGGSLRGKADVTDEAFGGAGTYTVTTVTLGLT